MSPYRVRVAVVLLVVALLVLLPVLPVLGVEGGVPEGSVSWLSTGDSYSSGEGVSGNRGDCAQSREAWGPRAADLMREPSRGWSIGPEGFTACTGHLVEDFYHQRDTRLSLFDWGHLEQGLPQRVDVITMSFGGNDIGFPDLIYDCVYLPFKWKDVQEFVAPVTGCDFSEAVIEERIDALIEPTATGCRGGRVGEVEGRVVDPDPYACDLMIGPAGERGTYADFLVKVAKNHLTPRGRLYLAGYPALLAPTGEWRLFEYAMCAGILRGDAEKLGRLAQRLDKVLEEAVRRANQTLGEDRVVYLSRYDLFRDGSHEQCGSGDEWINGLTIDREPGVDFRLEGSFHPNGKGHWNTARHLTEKIQFPPSDVVMRPDGLGTGLRFGSDGLAVIEGLVGRFGQPTSDSMEALVGLSNPSPEQRYGDESDFPSFTWEWPWIRVTCWNMLCITLASEQGDTWIFEGYEYSIWYHPDYRSQSYGAGTYPPLSPLISTAEGVTVGSAYGEFLTAYPDLVVSWGEGNGLMVEVPGWPPNYKYNVGTSSLDIGAQSIPGFDYGAITPDMVPSSARIVDFLIGNLPDPTCC